MESLTKRKEAAEAELQQLEAHVVVMMDTAYATVMDLQASPSHVHHYRHMAGITIPVAQMAAFANFPHYVSLQ